MIFCILLIILAIVILLGLKHINRVDEIRHNEFLVRTALNFFLEVLLEINGLKILSESHDIVNLSVNINATFTNEGLANMITNSFSPYKMIHNAIVAHNNVCKSTHSKYVKITINIDNKIIDLHSSF